MLLLLELKLAAAPDRRQIARRGGCNRPRELITPPPTPPPPLPGRAAPLRGKACCACYCKIVCRMAQGRQAGGGGGDAGAPGGRKMHCSAGMATSGAPVGACSPPPSPGSARLGAARRGAAQRSTSARVSKLPRDTPQVGWEKGEWLRREGGLMLAFFPLLGCVFACFYVYHMSQPASQQAGKLAHLFSSRRRGRGAKGREEVGTNKKLSYQRQRPNVRVERASEKVKEGTNERRRQRNETAASWSKRVA